MKTKTDLKTSVQKYLISVTLIGSLALTACRGETVNEKEPTRVDVNAKMNSDELTNAAEQLVGPYTFMLAYKTATMAVEKDPTNIKAQFYVNFLKRFEIFRGVYNRIKPMLNPEQLKGLEKSITEFPESPLKIFLLDNKSKADFKNIDDLQTVLGQYFSAVAEFRQFLKTNQNTEMVIYLNPHIFAEQIKQDQAGSCKYISDTDGSWAVECDSKLIASKKLNVADFLMLRQMASMELVYSLFTNSYSFQGIEKLEQIDPYGTMSNQQRTEYLASLPSFGKLRKENMFGLLKDMGSDLSTGIKWVQQYQKDICPKGTSTYNQREGYLFKDGLCIESDVQNPLNQFLATLDHALGGVTRIEMKDSENRPLMMNIDIFAWSKNPIQDLRQIKPTAWNACDAATSFSDNTLGGIFVDNNANILMDKSNCN